MLLDPALEIEPVEPARFDLPADARTTVQAKAALLADALRLTLRRGAGPFRSAAQLAFEPRIYQLVPLLMALRLPVPRLLIADDVGIGKTIEAGLILRELMDRGEVDSFSVLCPPHLVDQWVGELTSRFGIDAVAVTASSAARLERGLPLAQTLFDAYPFTVVSLDYIKAEKRRDGFARACPRMVVVDEAHACVGTHKGTQQRFELAVRAGAGSGTRHPHADRDPALRRRRSLRPPAVADRPVFASMNSTTPGIASVWRDTSCSVAGSILTSGDWDEERAFPKHETTEFPYRLSKPHLDFQEAVLDYCFGVVARAGAGQRERRLAFWGTLALMRCVGSSPAAALSALRNRAANESDRLEPQIYDDDGDDEDAVDIEPGTNLPVEPALGGTHRAGRAPRQQARPEDRGAAGLLSPLIRKGANPVVFCRFSRRLSMSATLCARLSRRLRIEAVTGVLTPDERRDRVADMADGRAAASWSRPTASPKASTCSSSSTRSSTTICRGTRRGISSARAASIASASLRGRSTRS